MFPTGIQSHRSAAASNSSRQYGSANPTMPIRAPGTPSCDSSDFAVSLCRIPPSERCATKLRAPVVSSHSTRRIRKNDDIDSAVCAPGVTTESNDTVFCISASKVGRTRSLGRAR